ncbi:MAG: hypothetical protein GY730_07305 [bacterium]|nr:hypothetical protein [bacterium]
MKEIKFRAWVRKEERLIPDDKIVSIFFIGGNGINEIIDDGSRYRFYSRDEVEISQYTCFKDSEGVDIYEEDYVEYILPDGMKIKGLVTWDKGLRIKKIEGESEDGQVSDVSFYQNGRELFIWSDLTVTGNKYTGMSQAIV